MPDHIQDASNRRPIECLRVSERHVKVRMEGENGFYAVISGERRLGEAVIGCQNYDIELPGAEVGEAFEVEFRRPG